ncbi:hypothetical protein N7536_005997 [Penicillium majusculum]|nr:hypothetical protein N7536_005997 [Penicillium majusculum]
MSTPEIQALTSEQVRAGLAAEVQATLAVLTDGEKELYLHLYNTRDHEMVHPVLYAAAERARSLLTHQAEVARLSGMVANAQAPPQAAPVMLTAPETSETATAATNQSARPSANVFNLSDMDRDVRRSIINDIRKIDNYDGTIQGDAARKWVVDCDRYFVELMNITGYDTPGAARIIHASGKLVKTALQRLENHKQVCENQRSGTFATWDDFKNWVKREFSEHLSQEKLWEKFDGLKQGRTSISAYAGNLRQAAADLNAGISEQLLIHRFIAGTKTEYQAKWAVEREQPTVLLEVVSLFIGYERGLTIARHHQNGSNASAGPDEMDLSVVTSRPPALQPTKETRSCHNCGKPGHLARNEAGGKLARPHDVEALVGRLQQAPEQPQFDAEDLLDPHHSESTPSRARPETPPQRQERGEEPKQRELSRTDRRQQEEPLHLSASLNVMSDSLTFYRGRVCTNPRQPIHVRMLLDSGASNTFISPRVWRRIGGTARLRKPKIPLWVTIANGERLETAGFAILPVKLGEWTGRIKAWVLETEYDVILGRDFLHSENPRIDWRTSVMTLTDHGRKTHDIYPTNGSRMIVKGEAHANLISARHVARALRKKNMEARLFMKTVRNQTTVRPLGS